ncbi:hypothetical protein H0A43_07450 [Arcobacter lanthieri]|nr:hypothetical protein [Aliarcobacter lanthieri]MBL3520307.1 hypothetical protein [Aliarcobacter lanthieri]
MTYFSLVKKGYGTLQELKSLDTDEIINIIDYENMMNDIEALAYDERTSK